MARCLTALLIFSFPVYIAAQGYAPKNGLRPSQPTITVEPAAAPHSCWCGVYPTVLTPWNCANAGVDTQALAAEIQYQLAGGVNGLLVLGTLGEGMYASEEERAQVISTAVTQAGGNVPVVVGIHHGEVHAAMKQLHQAKALGAQAVLVKYLGAPCASFKEVLEFFQTLASAHELPIFYYHHPSDMPRQLSPDEVIQILSLDNVVGAKESTLDLKEVRAHINGVAGQGKVFLSGTALNLTQFQKIGGNGVMCPEAAIIPADTVAAYETVYGVGAHHQARKEQRDLFVVAPLLKGGFITERSARMFTMTAQDLKLPQQIGPDESQARLKAALNQLGVPMSASVRGPLPQLSRWDQHIVNTTVKKIQSK